MSGWRRWRHFDAGPLLWTGRERCGFVVQTHELVDNYRLLEVENVASAAHQHFEISAADTFAVLDDRHHDVLGVWHSHPPGLPQPSTMDKEWTPYGLDIYIVCDLRIRRWTSNQFDYVESELPWTV